MDNKNYIKITSINECVSPIYTGSDEKSGVSLLLRNISIYDKEKGVINIPYIHGNTVRGYLRRLLMKDFFDSIGFEIKNKKLYHAFYSGGLLEKGKDSGVIDLDFRRKLVNTIPGISLLGCAFSNHMIQGKLSVSHMFPLCKEYSDYLPENIKDNRKSQNIRLFVDNTFITRRDDLGEREEGDAAVQMKVDYECIIPGTGLYHEFILEHTNTLEQSCFSRMLELWNQKSIVGAKSNVGEGKLKLNYDYNYNSDEYLKYLEENKEEIIKLLEEIEKLL